MRIVWAWPAKYRRDGIVHDKIILVILPVRCYFFSRYLKYLVNQLILLAGIIFQSAGEKICFSVCIVLLYRCFEGAAIVYPPQPEAGCPYGRGGAVWRCKKLTLLPIPEHSTVGPYPGTEMVIAYFFGGNQIELGPGR